MPKGHAAYAPEFRRQMVELVRSGRTPEELSGTGFVRPIAMQGGDKTERRAPSARN